MLTQHNEQIFLRPCIYLIELNILSKYFKSPLHNCTYSVGQKSLFYVGCVNAPPRPDAGSRNLGQTFSAISVLQTQTVLWCNRCNSRLSLSDPRRDVRLSDIVIIFGPSAEREESRRGILQNR